MSHIPVVAIAGGPCGGKSTFLARVRDWLGQFGLHALIVSETATELINAGVTPLLLGRERFQDRLFCYSLDREEHYIEMARDAAQKQTVILCDRGLLDGAAYVGTETYRAMIERLGHTQEDLRRRYDLVIHLVSAAVGAEEFYTCGNNAARSESVEEARDLEARTQLAWLGHPHHAIIDNSTNFEEKMRRALRALARRLNMPEPLEIERKFRILNFRREMIPHSAVAAEITQDYLVTRGSGIRRIRRSVCAGEATYTYTEKVPTGKSGTRIERERIIDKSEYERLLSERDAMLHTISKVRYRFPSEGKLFELDVFEGRLSGTVVLEVELQDRDEEVRLPRGWAAHEVTDDPAYGNSSLAAI